MTTVPNSSNEASVKPPCLILGGAGFLGSHLTHALLKTGYRVTVFDRPHVSFKNLDPILSKIRVVEGDLQNVEDLRPLMETHPFLFHVASNTLPGSANANPTYDVQDNLVATLGILDLAVKCKVEKIVFPSSGGTIYGASAGIPSKETDHTDPISSYGITKLSIEKYLELYRHLHGLDYLCLRISNPYGEYQRGGNQGIIATFLNLIRKGRPLQIWGDGKIIRDYIYVADVIEAILKGLDYKGSYRIFNIGSGVDTSITQLVDILKTITGKFFDVQHMPARNCDLPYAVLNISRAGQELEWTPHTDLETGIRRLWEKMK